MKRICKTLCWLVLACLMVASPLNVQESAAQESSDALFPTSPEAWLNSPPLSSENLKNKAAILYFFEEG